MITFLNKFEVAKILTNQYEMPEDMRDTIAQKLAKTQEPYFSAMVFKSGITVDNFGYNRYFVK